MSEKEDILKKKMETKGSLRRPRGHIPGPRTVSRIAASILAGCMILMIMTASLPLTWSIPEAGVYAAETAASAAASDPASDAAPGQMTSGGEYDNAADKASGNAASAKTDGPAADRDDADRTYINQAEYVSDTEKIEIPTIEEAQILRAAENGPDAGAGEADNNKDSSGLVNINTAGREELMTLPGIGESKASGIIKYRESHGPFGNKEEIMNVSGIGSSVYEKLEDCISVE